MAVGQLARVCVRPRPALGLHVSMLVCEGVLRAQEAALARWLVLCHVAASKQAHTRDARLHAHGKCRITAIDRVCGHHHH